MAKILLMVCSLVACAGLESTASAAPQEGDRATTNRLGAELRQRNPAALPGAKSNRPDGRAGQAAKAGGMRDPSQMVNLMMQKFDADGDDQLNRDELVAMFAFMQERRGQQGGSGDRPRQRPELGTAAREGKDNEVGGVTPRRPPGE